jgi:hypothetical protein
MVCLLEHGQFSWPTVRLPEGMLEVQGMFATIWSPQEAQGAWSGEAQDAWSGDETCDQNLQGSADAWSWACGGANFSGSILLELRVSSFFLKMWCDVCGSLWRFPEMRVPPVIISMLNQPAIGGTPMYGTLPFGDFQVSGTNPQPPSAGHDRATTPVRRPEKKRVGRFDSPVLWKRSLKIDRKRSFQI